MKKVSGNNHDYGSVASKLAKSDFITFSIEEKVNKNSRPAPP